MWRSKMASVMAAAAVASGLALICSPGTSTAQTRPCTEDIKTICGDVTKGGGRILRCYEERKDKFSAACRGWAETAKANAAVVKETCSKEIDARCNSEKGDPLEMLDCLQSNYVDLSTVCREKLNSFKGMYPLPVQ